MRRVVVTGLGVVSPIGIGIDSFIEALQKGQSGVGKISLFDASDYSVICGRCMEDLGLPGYMRISNKKIKKIFHRQDKQMKKEALAEADSAVVKQEISG